MATDFTKTHKERVLERYPDAEAVKLGRARWAIASDGGYLQRQSGNTAADAWARAANYIANGGERVSA